MIRRPPRSTRTDTLVPYTTLFRSVLTQPISATSSSSAHDIHYAQQVKILINREGGKHAERPRRNRRQWRGRPRFHQARHGVRRRAGRASRNIRSEEHTSELQSLMRISYAVFCLKKKTTKNQTKASQ